LNVPVKNGKVTSDIRIQASVPTIEKALAAGAAVILLSHLGRPVEGQYDEASSLKRLLNICNPAWQASQTGKRLAGWNLLHRVKLFFVKTALQCGEEKQ